jgi:Holliday junction resolvase RusA-like endonuclease
MLTVVMRPRSVEAAVHRIFVDRTPPRAGLHRKKFGGQRRDGRIVLYDDASLEAARDYWKEAVLKSGKQNLNLTGPLGLRLVLVFPHPKEASYKVGSRFVLRDKSPDCSNLLKVCEDVLQSMCVVDNDSRFASVSVTKMTGPRPCALVEIMELASAAEVAFKPAVEPGS